MDENKEVPGVWLIPCPYCGYLRHYSWDQRDEYFICPGCYEDLKLIPVWLDRMTRIAYGLKLVRSADSTDHGNVQSNTPTESGGDVGGEPAQWKEGR